MAHNSLPANKALTYDPKGTGGHCPCKKCRPKGTSFKAAMRLAVKYGELRNFGVDGVAERARLQAERLAELKRKK